MNKAFTAISAGLKDAAAHAKSDKSGVIEHTPETLNVKAIREKTGMSQQRFCATFSHFLSPSSICALGLAVPLNLPIPTYR